MAEEKILAEIKSLFNQEQILIDKRKEMVWEFIEAKIPFVKKWGIIAVRSQSTKDETYMVDDIDLNNKALSTSSVKSMNQYINGCSLILIRVVDTGLGAKKVLLSVKDIAKMDVDYVCSRVDFRSLSKENRINPNLTRENIMRLHNALNNKFTKP